MNFFAILLDKEALFYLFLFFLSIVDFAYECAGVGGSSVGALVGADADLDVPTTRQ